MNQAKAVLFQPASEFLPMIDEVGRHLSFGSVNNASTIVLMHKGTNHIESYLICLLKVYKALEEKTKSTPGAKVENNKFCLSVHFRCVDEKVRNFFLFLNSFLRVPTSYFML